MRKINPVDVHKDFNSALNKLINFYILVAKSLPKEDDKSFLAENIIISAAALWEGFINDLFISYINNDNSRFIMHLRNALAEKQNPKQKEISSRYVKFDFPKHMKVKEITSLLDKSGSNITFSTYVDLKKGAKSYLSPVHSDKFKNITRAQGATIDLWISIRNHIAHRSERSRIKMDECLKTGALHNTGLKRGRNAVNDIGAYLKAREKNNSMPRINIIFDSMREISTTFS